MRKKTIVIDMDDTITSETLTEIINEYLGTNYKDEDFEGFYKQDIIKDKDDFFKFFLTKNEYDYGHINDNAVSVIKELNEKYEVFIGTSFIFKEIVSDSGIFVKNKYDFLCGFRLCKIRKEREIMKKKFSIVNIVALFAAVCLYSACSGKDDFLPEVQFGSENESNQNLEEPEETLESNPDSSWAVGKFPVPPPDGDD